MTFTSLSLINETGNSAITDYSVIYKDVTDPLNPGADTVVSFATLTSSTLTGLTSNKTYQIRVRASNLYGSGPDSSTQNIHMSISPSGMQKPTLSYSSRTVTATWPLPTENGASIIQYQVQFWNMSSSQFIEVAQCDGSVTLVISSRSCSV